MLVVMAVAVAVAVEEETPAVDEDDEDGTGTCSDGLFMLAVLIRKMIKMMNGTQ